MQFGFGPGGLFFEADQDCEKPLHQSLVLHQVPADPSGLYSASLRSRIQFHPCNLTQRGSEYRRIAAIGEILSHPVNLAPAGLSPSFARAAETDPMNGHLAANAASSCLARFTSSLCR